MMLVKKQLIATMLTVAVAGLATQSAPASTGTADVRYTGVVSGPTVLTDLSGHITDGLIRVWGDGHSGTLGKGGIYILDLGATTGEGNDIVTQIGGPNAGQIYSFCVELPQVASNLFQTYDVDIVDVAPDPNYAPIGGNLGAAKASYIRELWAANFAAAAANGTVAEAMSIAIWELVYESYEANPLNYDVTVWSNIPASFKAVDPEGTSTAIANAMLWALVGGAQADLRGLTHASYQDWLVEVPEPASLALLGVGSAMMLYRRRRAS